MTAAPIGSTSASLNEASCAATTEQAPPQAPSRSVARPLMNLGNTCYVNAVLQALSHAPELCLAMDTEPHAPHCPIAKSNEAKLEKLRLRQLAEGGSGGSAKRKSPASSPSQEGDNTNDLPPPLPQPARRPQQQGIRKSRRSGRRSPQDGAGGASVGSNGDAIDACGGNRNSADALEYCALCEIENHVRQVHDKTEPSNANKPYAPSTFVHGFIDHVAPWFKLGVQEDSHEFLRLLIDAMQKSSKQAREHNSSTSQSKNVAAGVEEGSDPESSTNGPARMATRSSPRLGGSSCDDSPSTGAAPALAPANAVTTAAAAVGNHPMTISSSMNSTGLVSDQDKEYPFSLFRGMVESNVCCESCKATSATLDPIEDIGLDVTPMIQDENATANYVSSAPAAGVTSSSTRSRNNSPTPGGTSGGGGPSSHALADVQTAFQRFARAEPLDCGYKCEKCGKVGRATKQSRLACIPPILTLHLKRFRYGAHGAADGLMMDGGAMGAGYMAQAPTTRQTRSGARTSEVGQLMSGNADFNFSKSGSAKIEGHVRFDVCFDLRPYLTEQLQKTQKSLFCRLFAVLVHAGKNSHSGHYICYVSNVQKNEWWKMDDGRVSRVMLNEVLNAEAYMLFYRVVQHPVALQLEQAYQAKIQEAKKKETEAAAAKEGLKSEATNVSNGKEDDKASSSKKKKKRSIAETSQYHDGEDWARKRTRVSPFMRGIFKLAEERIADKVTWSDELLESLKKTKSASSSATTTPPTITATASTVSEDDVDDENSDARTQASSNAIPDTETDFGEEDVVGGTGPHREKLLKLIYLVEKHLKSKNGAEDQNALETWLTREIKDQDLQEYFAVESTLDKDGEATAAADEKVSSSTIKAIIKSKIGQTIASAGVDSNTVSSTRVSSMSIELIEPDHAAASDVL